jgi:hypothetical protein
MGRAARRPDRFLSREVYDWQLTIGTLAARYFQGVNPLMPETEERLADMVAEAELLAERFNDALELEAAFRKGNRKRKRKLPTPVDAEAVRRNTQAAESQASLLVDMDLASPAAADRRTIRRRSLASGDVKAIMRSSPHSSGR